MNTSNHLVIGVTGGIGSGKTAVTDELSRLGIDIVDADQVSRDVVAPGSPALQQIAQRFGADILAGDGTLRRRALRDIIFSSPDDKQWLESLLHPLIREEIIMRLSRSESRYTVLVSPLLLETGQNKMCHRVLLVDVPEALQVTRTQIRDDTSGAAVKAIMEQQMSRTQRLALADDVIVNDGTLPELYDAVGKLHTKYLTLAADIAATNSGEPMP